MSAIIKSIFPILGGRSVREEVKEEFQDLDTFSTAIDARVSVYPLGENHPLAHLFGIFDDDPMWEDFEAAIRENPTVIE